MHLSQLAGDVPEFPKAKAKTAPSRNQNLSPIYPPQATTSVSTLSKNSSDAGSPSPRPSPATNATIPKLTNVVPPRGAGGKTKPRDTAKVSGAVSVFVMLFVVVNIYRYFSGIR